MDVCGRMDGWFVGWIDDGWMKRKIESSAVFLWVKQIFFPTTNFNYFLSFFLFRRKLIFSFLPSNAKESGSFFLATHQGMENFIARELRRNVIKIQIL